MTKDQWIQEAKALLFDFTHATDSPDLARVAFALIDAGGGYNPRIEGPFSPLRWDGKRVDDKNKEENGTYFLGGKL